MFVIHWGYNNFFNDIGNIQYVQYLTSKLFPPSFENRFPILSIYFYCPVCITKGITTPMYKRDQKVKGVYKCDNCDHIYVDYPGSAIKYHKNEYRESGKGTRTDNEIKGGKFTNNFHNARKDIVNRRSKVLEKRLNLDECKTMLDIGAGGGTFVDKIRNDFPHNFESIECQEVSDICVNNLRQYGYTTYHGDINKLDIDKKYDLVTCWHVLEHINDIATFAKKVNKLVKKYLIIEVPLAKPGNSGYTRIPKLTSWDGHHHFFTEKSMRLLLENYFTKIEVGNAIQNPSLQVICTK
jgi:rubredoxin